MKLSNTRLSKRFVVRFFVKLFFYSAFVSLVANYQGIQIQFSYAVVVPVLSAIFLMLGPDISRRPHIVRKDSLFKILLFASTIISVCLSRDAVGAIENSLYIIYLFAAIYIFDRAIKTRVLNEREIIKMVAFVYYVFCTIGLIQLVTRAPFGLLSTYFGDSSLEGSFYSGTFRVSGPIRSPNVFAIVVQYCSLVLIASELFGRRRPKLLKILLYVVVSVALVFGSLSRSGMLFLVMSYLGQYFFWLVRDGSVKNRYVTFLVFPVVLVFVYLMFALGFLSIFGVDRLFNTAVVIGEGGSRIEMAKVAVELISMPKIFFFGVGSGQFLSEVRSQGIYMDYKWWSDADLIAVSVHNWVLQAWTELGVFALLGWAIFIMHCYKGGFNAGDLSQGFLARSLGFAAVCLFCTALLFDTSLANPSVLVLLALSWSCIRGLATGDDMLVSGEVRLN